MKYLKFILLGICIIPCANAFSQKANKDNSEPKEDSVTHLQSADAFNTLEDGQPTPQGFLEVRVLPTYAYSVAENTIIGIEPELEYTPKGKSNFAKNAQLLASFFLEHDGTDNSGQLNLGWNQRWVTDGGRKSMKPTLATLVEYNFPLPGLRKTEAFLNGSKAGSYVKVTGVYAKFLGPGSIYLNLAARKQFNSVTTDSTLNEQNVLVDGDHWTKSLFTYRVGYNWIVKKDKFNIIVDYEHQTNEFKTQPNATPDELHKPYNLVEASVEWVISKHLTVGPGFLFGVDKRDETPRYGVGCLFLFE